MGQCRKPRVAETQEAYILGLTSVDEEIIGIIRTLFSTFTLVNMKLLNILPIFAIGGVYATVLPYDAHSHLSRREVNGSYIPSTAPYDNIFSDISAQEEESIYAFLKRQANVTMSVPSFFNDLTAANPSPAQERYNSTKVGLCGCLRRTRRTQPLI